MGGCDSCSSKGGCDGRKETERDLLAELMPRLYPTGRWGEPDDSARLDGGLGSHEGKRLARQAAEVLQARTYFRPGGDDENCDYVYVLCVGREPGLYELADRDAMWVPDGDSISERYLRVALSSMAKVAALQEVVFELQRQGDTYVIEEKPRNGVFDPILLKRTQKIVDLIVGAGVTYLDFGLIELPPDGFEAGDYPYGQTPGIVNYLFYPQPATTASTRFVSCSEGASLS